MHALIAWWLALSLLGWCSWPLIALLMPHTPGKGLGLARILGLLLLTYLVWLLQTLAPPSDGELVTRLAFAALLLLGGGVGLAHRQALWGFLRRSWRQVAAMEGIFVVALVLFAMQRAYAPAIAHTEQPMDFAFLNACLRSARMPPADPWLAGHAVSYYYGGYLSVAVLCRLTGVSSGVGYNLGLAHTLALMVVAGYSLIHQLAGLAGGASCGAPEGSHARSIIALLGGLALALASNLEGPIEALRALGVGSDRLYGWLGIPGLLGAPSSAASLIPDGHWWWWRASRVVTDANFLGKNATVITEFPAFSFLLGDLHPHFVTAPYAMLTLGLSFELYLAVATGGVKGWWRRWHYWSLPIIYGALGFLNTWDLPTFGFIALAALLAGAWHARRRGTALGLCRSVLALAAWIILGSLLFYAPFYRDLSSQAQGIGLAYYTKTPLRHYAIVWGGWIPGILVTLLHKRGAPWAQRAPRRWWLLSTWAGIAILPWAATWVLGGWGRVLLGASVGLIISPWLTLLLSGALAMLLWRCAWLLDWSAGMIPYGVQGTGLLGACFTVLLGLGLTYMAEFFYLRDSFDTRMNTVFKLYYQAWILLGIGASVGIYTWWTGNDRRRWLGLAFGLLFCVSLYYPLAAAYTRADGYGRAPTLDGTTYLRDESPGEYGAITWLRDHAREDDVLVEAVGEDYVAEHNRLSAWTGVPTILGWPGHETQWRGSDEEVARRIVAVERVYRATSREELESLLHSYSVSYLYVGPHESDKYQLDATRLDWYAGLFQTVYAADGVRLYRIPRG